MKSADARLLSLDALRGADMLVIIGLDALVHQIEAASSSRCWETLSLQFRHVPWEGLSLYDCVFPLFVFIAGIAQYLSWRKASAHGVLPGRRIMHAWKRAFILVLLGWIVNGSLVWDTGSMRYASVLGLIGISCAASSTCLILFQRTWVITMSAILLLLGIGVAEMQFGDLTPAGCVNALVDRQWCPGILHNGPYDPEGLLCLISATALALLGILCGRVLSINSAVKRLVTLFLLCLGLLALGQVGPIIKNIWSPAFCLTTAGLGMGLMALFHLAIDIPRWQVWNYPLRVIGVNALFIYMATALINFPALADRLLGGTWSYLLPEGWHGVAQYATSLLLAWLLCFYLAHKHLFIRI